ncbi:MAG TPA: hypothetical protein VGC20_04225, partial [bacterium]
MIQSVGHRVKGERHLIQFARSGRGANPGGLVTGGEALRGAQQTAHRMQDEAIAAEPSSGD